MYVEMKPGASVDTTEQDSVYVEMKPAGLHPPPSAPAPIYAVPIMTPTPGIAEKTEESSDDSLYYASIDMLLAKRS